MSRYRQTMSEALKQVREVDNDYLKPRMTPQQIANIKKTWQNKKASDVTPAIKKMIKDMDIPTQMAIKQANIPHISKLVEEDDHEISMARGELEAVADKALKLSSMLQGKSDETDGLEAWVQSKITKAKDYINSVVDYMTYNPDMANEHMIEAFTDQQIAKLRKEYEPLRDKRISVTNANKLGAMFSKFDSNKNALEKLYGGNIPFISAMAMSRLISKHGYTADKIKKIKVAEEVEFLDEGTGTIKGFRNDKEKSNMVSLAKQHGLKVKDVAGGIELMGNMRKILDMQLAAQGNGLKAEEYVEEGRMSQIDQMRKQGASAADIAKELKLDVKTVKAILGEQLTEEEDTEKLKKELEQKEDEIQALKTKAETEKAKVAKKETEKLVNPETGEPLLQVGVAYKHLRDKMAKEKASEDELKQKEKENKRKMVQKFRDRIKGKNEENELTESEASDKAKAMGLDYMKFGRYGKDGKVTHKTSGNSLVKVDKDGNEVEDKPKSDEPQKDTSKDTPSKEPKLDPFDVQKDLSDLVTDGMIDVETTEQGGLYMQKEYEPSQDYEADKDVEAIEKYLKSKGVDVDRDVMIENDDDDREDAYIQINIEYRPGKTMKPESVQVKEMAKDKAYAIGMATAKKKYNDEPPLEKKTIKKGHEIADKLMGMKKEETIKEFKKMTVTIADPMKRTKAMKDIEGQGFKIQRLGSRDFKVDGKGADLNKYATDLKNFYGATVKAEGTMIGGIVTDNSGKKMPGYDKAKKALKDFMSKPQPAKGASDKVMSFIFDDELLDDLYTAEKRKTADVRPLVKKRLKALGIKENAPTLTDLERLKKQGMKPKKEETQHNLAKMKYEQIAGLKKKAEKSGMPYSILKKVYDRGMAAWRGGHRPGATQQQWAFARVNSFVTKSSGTWGGADKDLAAKVRGSK